MKVEAGRLKKWNTKELKVKETKLKEINFMNVILCFSVVMIHLTASPLATLRKDSIWYLIIFIINKALSFCVPAFIFLSGFKLYNKYKEEKINIKKYLIRKNQKNSNSIYNFCNYIFYIFL